ncbi:DUF3592 domain-containing protein [Streptomyces sp. NA02950]|uniref:DUF3592 domain-containing protein n=1 Tax=Streptomyces sp. NA02950 TaxID=2742137 RepID=UPI001591D30E|nr:DUF3592 domain-containing protein [Streptomyces sp. NA02950]QKV90766.1 DUF3592 domain-containing protein [Streptomyces sp. NA02950]
MSPSVVPWFLSTVFMLIGGTLGVIAYRGFRKVRRLLQRGARTQGVVTRLRATEMRPAGSEATITLKSSGTTVYYPVISWTTADNHPMETEGTLARPLGRTPAPGTRVTVVYDPADPSRWTLSSEGTVMYGLVAGIGAVFAVAGVTILLVRVLAGPF